MSYCTDTINVCHGTINPMADITLINQPICSENSRVLWAAKIVGNGINITTIQPLLSNFSSQNAITDNAIDNHQNVIHVAFFGNEKCGEDALPDFITAYNADGTIGGKILSSKCLDAIIVKYDIYGLVKWITKISGLSNESPVKVTVDSYRNIIITGTYFSFRPSIYSSCGTVATVLPPSSGYTSFIVKYNPEGNMVWSTIVSASERAIITGITIDITNNIYIVGTYQGRCVNFFGANGIAKSTLPDSSSTDIFLAKYSPDGSIQWSTRLAGSSLDTGRDIAVNNDGSIIVAGAYSKTLTLYNPPNGSIPSTISLSTNNPSAFIAKYSTEGKAIWATQIENISKSPVKVAVDSLFNIVLAGSYQSFPLIFLGRSSTEKIELDTNLNNHMTMFNAFVAKFDPNGNPLWATKIAGNRNELVLDLTIDYHDSIVVTGSFTSSSITIYHANNTIGPRLSNTDNIDAFIVKYNKIGRALWATKQSGRLMDRGIAVSTDYRNNVYGSGIFFSPKLFLHNSDGSVGKILLNHAFDRKNSYLVKYVNYCQILKLTPALALEHTKTIILNEYHGRNTLVHADVGVLYDANDRMIFGIVLSDQLSKAILQWRNNRWTLLLADAVNIIYVS